MGVSLQYFAAISSALGALSAGTALGWTSNLELKIQRGDYGFIVSPVEYSILGSMLNLGAAFVCILAGYIMNIVGRRNLMLLIVFPFLIGWILLMIPQNVVMIIVGRALIGVACGGICVSGPVYTGEIAEKQIRGKLGSFFQLLITSGILLVYLLGWIAGPQLTSLICGIIPILFGICMFFCPESPTFMIMKGDNEGAVKSLERFRGPHVDVTAEINDLQREEEIRQSENIREALKKRSSQKAMMISFGLMFFQQMCGINAVIFYTATIFGEANNAISPEISTIIVGVMQVIATFIATMTLDKLGRRFLLLVSDSLMALCTLTLAIFYAFRYSNPESVKDLGWLSLLSLCVFIVAFSLGFGPVPWLMLGELFSSDVKGVAGSLSGTLNWTLAFLVTVSYPPIKELIGPAMCFVIFTVLSCIGTIFCFFLVPETKGKSLSEIQKMLEK